MVDPYASTPEGEYNRGVIDYRKEQGNNKEKMETHSPKRNRSRSRSPLRRSRSPRDDRRDRDRRDRRSGPMRNKGTKGKEFRCYVTNLCFNVKWMNLKDLMKKIGPVDHVEVFTGSDGKSRGCGVVEFEKAEDAERAIKELEGTIHEGRTIHVRQDNVADSTYEEQLRQQKEKTKNMREREMNDRMGPNMSGGASNNGGLLGSLGSLGGLGGLGGLGMISNQANGLMQMLTTKGGDPINATVFISNLDYDIRWQELKDSLRRAGNCRTCTINTDEKSRKSKGFGQAVFDTPMEALTCIATFNGYEMGRDRRAIVVRLDRQAPLNQLLYQIGITEINQNTLVQFQSMQLLSQLGGLSNLQGLSALTGVAGAFQGQNNLGGQAGGSQALGALTSSLGLGNLGGLGSLLSQGTGSSAGMNAYGTQSAQQGQFNSGASNLGGAYTAGQQLSNYSITGQRSSSGGYSTQDSRGGGSGSGGYGGYSATDASSGGGSSTAKTRVFVRNLPFSLKWQDLKDRFRDAGRILRADVKMDDQNRSKGCGTVTFETHDEAQKAISIFNASRIDGREIEVRMDRSVGER